MVKRVDQVVEEAVVGAEKTAKKMTNNAEKVVKDVVEDVEKFVRETPFDEFVEHQKKAVKEFGKAFEAMLPDGLREHGEAAVRESVEGYRRLFNDTIDNMIKNLEKAKFEDKPEKEMV